MTRIACALALVRRRVRSSRCCAKWRYDNEARLQRWCTRRARRVRNAAGFGRRRRAIHAHERARHRSSRDQLRRDHHVDPHAGQNRRGRRHRLRLRFARRLRERRVVLRRGRRPVRQSYRAARFILDGKTYTLAANDGANSLHGGAAVSTKSYGRVSHSRTAIRPASRSGTRVTMVKKATLER